MDRVEFNANTAEQGGTPHLLTYSLTCALTYVLTYFNASTAERGGTPPLSTPSDHIHHLTAPHPLPRSTAVTSPLAGGVLLRATDASFERCIFSENGRLAELDVEEGEGLG